ncbi:MAG: VWA domain-containing protein [Pseudomonadota bacterium]|nr:VWA domain-containing protein [Pseudomonadota bacterium]
MERWHMTLLLAAAATLGALVAPTLDARYRAIPVATPLDPAADPELIPEAALARGGQLALDVRMDRDTVLQHGDNLRYVVVSVTAPDVESERVPVDIAVVVDTSGSMGREGKIEAARAAADELVDSLREGDRFALVSFDDRARVLVEGARFDGDTARLHGVIEGLRDDGGTNLWDGLELGEDQLSSTRAYSSAYARKVLLVSDGQANVGETSPEAFARLAQGYASAGVSVSAIGLGRDFNENLLEAMADAGGGSYRFVGNPEELPTVIAAELERTTKTQARRALVRLHAGVGVRIREVYGWTSTLDTEAGGGAEVFLGDVSAGQTRKIVLAVEVPAQALGDLSVLRAELSWAPVDDGERLGADASVAAQITTSPAAVSASIDEAATVAATRARAGALTRASADAWRDGDGAKAKAMMRSASSVIAETLAEVDDPGLRADRETMSTIESLGSSEGASYAAKAASEAGRDLSR